MQGWPQRGQEDESVGDPENPRRAGRCYLLDRCSPIRVIPSQRSVQPLGSLVLLSIGMSKRLNQPRNYPISAHEIPKFTSMKMCARLQLTSLSMQRGCDKCCVPERSWASFGGEQDEEQRA